MHGTILAKSTGPEDWWTSLTKYLDLTCRAVSNVHRTKAQREDHPRTSSSVRVTTITCNSPDRFIPQGLTGTTDMQCGETDEIAYIAPPDGNSLIRAQELCESRGGRPGLPSLISLRFLWT